MCEILYLIIIYKTKVLFNEAKIYFYGKNHIKSEVAVFATPLYYYVFISNHMYSSMYNFKIIKRKYYCYLKYLLKN
jgi:hypothetical protein